MNDKDLRKFLREAEQQGWTSKFIKAGELWFSPDGITKVTVHGTPSDVRSFNNMVAEFRKGGMQWPPKK